MGTGPSIAVDLSRLVTSLRFTSPSGVERMELGYGADLGPSGHGIVLSPLGPCDVGSGGRRKLVDIAQEHWREDQVDIEPELAPVLDFLKDRSSGPRAVPKPPRLPLRVMPVLAAAAFRKPSAKLPPDTVYFHANFFRLERPAFFDWLDLRRDVRAVFMIYDLLPIQFPGFFRPGEDVLHRRRIETVARHAHKIVVAAETIAEDLTRHLRESGLRVPPIEIVGLPAAPLFWEPQEIAALDDAPPYFIVCGTIEPRKNHKLLLDVWRHLVEMHGEAAPKLIIAGRRGWNNEGVFGMLDNLGALRRHIFETAALSSHALAALFRASRALLSPSISEGFGLPVAEALAAGTHAIVSDMPIYREMWSGQATLVDPGDVVGWADAIMATKRSQLNGSPPRVMTWRAHADRMERLIVAS